MGHHRIFKPFHSCAVSWIRANSDKNVKNTEVPHWDPSASISELIFTCLHFCPRSAESESHRTAPPPEPRCPRMGCATPSLESTNFIQVFEENQWVNSVYPNIRMIDSYFTLQRLHAFLDGLITDPWNLFGMERERKSVTRKLTGRQACSDRKYLRPVRCSFFLLPLLSLQFLPQLQVVPNLFLLVSGHGYSCYYGHCFVNSTCHLPEL